MLVAHALLGGRLFGRPVRVQADRLDRERRRFPSERLGKYSAEHLIGDTAVRIVRQHTPPRRPFEIVVALHAHALLAQREDRPLGGGVCRDILDPLAGVEDGPCAVATRRQGSDHETRHLGERIANLLGRQAVAVLGYVVKVDMHQAVEPLDVLAARETVENHAGEDLPQAFVLLSRLRPDRHRRGLQRRISADVCPQLGHPERRLFQIRGLDAALVLHPWPGLLGLDHRLRVAWRDGGTLGGLRRRFCDGDFGRIWVWRHRHERRLIDPCLAGFAHLRERLEFVHVRRPRYALVQPVVAIVAVRQRRVAPVDDEVIIVSRREDMLGIDRAARHGNGHRALVKIPLRPQKKRPPDAHAQLLIRPSRAGLHAVKKTPQRSAAVVRFFRDKKLNSSASGAVDRERGEMVRREQLERVIADRALGDIFLLRRLPARVRERFDILGGVPVAGGRRSLGQHADRRGVERKQVAAGESRCGHRDRGVAGNKGGDRLVQNRLARPLPAVGRREAEDLETAERSEIAQGQKVRPGIKNKGLPFAQGVLGIFVRYRALQDRIQDLVRRRAVTEQRRGCGDDGRSPIRRVHAFSPVHVDQLVRPHGAVRGDAVQVIIWLVLRPERAERDRDDLGLTRLFVDLAVAHPFMHIGDRQRRVVLNAPEADSAFAVLQNGIVRRAEQVAELGHLVDRRTVLRFHNGLDRPRGPAKRGQTEDLGALLGRDLGLRFRQGRAQVGDLRREIFRAAARKQSRLYCSGYGHVSEP